MPRTRGASSLRRCSASVSSTGSLYRIASASLPLKDPASPPPPAALSSLRSFSMPAQQQSLGLKGRAAGCHQRVLHDERHLGKHTSRAAAVLLKTMTGPLATQPQHSIEVHVLARAYLARPPQLAHGWSHSPAAAPAAAHSARGRGRPCMAGRRGRRAPPGPPAALRRRPPAGPLATAASRMQRPQAALSWRLQ